MCDEQISEEDENAHKLREYYDNRVSYYDSWVKAWIENRMELDKQLLTLSTLAIGLLISVFGEPKTVTQFWLWLFAELFFLACAFVILIIFGKNTEYIETLLEDHQTADDSEEKVILGQKEKEKTRLLNRLTMLAFLLFLFGSLLTGILAIGQSGFPIMEGA